MTRSDQYISQAPPRGARATTMTTRGAFVQLAVVGVAAIGGLLVWAIAGPLAGVPLVVAAGGSPMAITPVSIVVAAVVTGAAAWLLLALLSRHPRGLAAWTIVGTVVLLLSLLGPALSGAAGMTLVALEAMHLVVGGTLIIGLRRTASRRDA